MEGIFIKPVIGEIYENNGGGSYKCIGYEPDNGEPIMENINTSWTLVAHAVKQYPDGKIDWGHSTGGYFKVNPYQRKTINKKKSVSP